jgi:hypothetical protein
VINCVTHIDLTLGHHRREHVRWINYPWKLCGPVPQLFILLGVQFHVSVSFGLWQVAVDYLNVYLRHKYSPESHRASKSCCQIFCFFGIYCWKLTLPSYNMSTISTARCFFGLYISQILLFKLSEIFLIFESLKQPESSHVSGLSSYSTWRSLYNVEGAITCHHMNSMECICSSVNRQSLRLLQWTCSIELWCKKYIYFLSCNIG